MQGRQSLSRQSLCENKTENSLRSTFTSSTGPRGRGALGLLRFNYLRLQVPILLITLYSQMSLENPTGSWGGAWLAAAQGATQRGLPSPCPTLKHLDPQGTSLPSLPRESPRHPYELARQEFLLLSRMEKLRHVQGGDVSGSSFLIPTGTWPRNSLRGDSGVRPLPAAGSGSQTLREVQKALLDEHMRD